jgi:hypothetical protein
MSTITQRGAFTPGELKTIRRITRQVWDVLEKSHHDVEHAKLSLNQLGANAHRQCRGEIGGVFTELTFFSERFLIYARESMPDDCKERMLRRRQREQRRKQRRIDANKRELTRLVEEFDEIALQQAAENLKHIVESDAKRQRCAE